MDHNSERAAVFEKIKEYLEKYLRTMTLKRSRVIAQDSLLYHDLGMRGIDANEFMHFLEDEFGIDFAGFRFKTYFHHEYFAVQDIFRAIFKIYDESKKPLSVGHIVDVCLAKKWFDPSE